MIIKYNTNNNGPYFLDIPSTLTAFKGKKTTFFFGKIADDENDEFYLADWNYSTEE